MNKNGLAVAWIILSVLILLGAVYALFIYKNNNKQVQDIEQEINETINQINNLSIIDEETPMTFEELKARIDAINNRTWYIINLSRQLEEEKSKRRGGGGSNPITPPAPLY